MFQRLRRYQIDEFGASLEQLIDPPMALLHVEPSVSSGEVEAEAEVQLPPEIRSLPLEHRARPSASEKFPPQKEAPIGITIEGQHSV